MSPTAIPSTSKTVSIVLTGQEPAEGFVGTEIIL
jgi:hypothetical protein